MSEARSRLIGPRLPHVVGVGVVSSGSIVDVVAEEIGDERAVNAGTVKELRKPPGRVLSELGLGVIHRVLGLALAIARLPFRRCARRRRPYLELVALVPAEVVGM